MVILPLRYIPIFLALSCNQQKESKATTENKPDDRPSETIEDIPGFLVNTENIFVLDQGSTLEITGDPAAVTRTDGGLVTDLHATFVSILDDDDFDRLSSSPSLAGILAVEYEYLGSVQITADGSFHKIVSVDADDLDHLLILALSDNNVADLASGSE